MEQAGFRCPKCGELHFDVPFELLKKSKCWLRKDGIRRVRVCESCKAGWHQWPTRQERGDRPDEDPEEEGPDGVGFSSKEDRAIGSAYWDQLWGRDEGDDDVLD